MKENARTICIAFITLLVIVTSVPCMRGPEKVGIQPLGKVNPAVIRKVEQGIVERYNVEVTVLPEVAFPEYAFSPKKSRYRAEKLLAYLAGIGVGTYDRILGITEKDISTTKGSIPDWGIFGLGSVSGRTCVISSYRLKGVSKEAFFVRMIKVANHELGHTFGIPHCPNAGCLMEDARGTVKTVDRNDGSLCGRCRETLGALVKDAQ